MSFTASFRQLVRSADAAPFRLLDLSPDVVARLQAEDVPRLLGGAAHVDDDMIFIMLRTEWPGFSYGLDFPQDVEPMLTLDAQGRAQTVLECDDFDPPIAFPVEFTFHKLRPLTPNDLKPL